MYEPNNDNFIAVLNIKELESLLNKGVIVMSEQDDSDFVGHSKFLQRDFRKYIYNGK